MGNSGSSSGNATVPGATVLKIAADDAVSSKTPPNDADLEGALKVMGVDSSGMEPAGMLASFCLHYCSTPLWVVSPLLFFFKSYDGVESRLCSCAYMNGFRRCFWTSFSAYFDVPMRLIRCMSESLHCPLPS